ncbi:hypothetical protein HYPSUDRAFT_45263, partial [Hypholoma sublateritium FD-334 SS-4]
MKQAGFIPYLYQLVAPQPDKLITKDCSSPFDTLGEQGEVLHFPISGSSADQQSTLQPAIHLSLDRIDYIYKHSGRPRNSTVLSCRRWRQRDGSINSDNDHHHHITGTRPFMALDLLGAQRSALNLGPRRRSTFIGMTSNRFLSSSSGRPVTISTGQERLYPCPVSVIGTGSRHILSSLHGHGNLGDGVLSPGILWPLGFIDQFFVSYVPGWTKRRRCRRRAKKRQITILPPTTI